MDSSVSDPQQQPPQPENCQPQRPVEQSHPQAQDSYYYYQQNALQSAEGSYGKNHDNHTSSEGHDPAYQHPPQLASGTTSLPSQIPAQSPAEGVPPGLNPAAAAAVAALPELSEFAGSVSQQEAMNGGILGPGAGLLHDPRPQSQPNEGAAGTNGRGFPRRWRGRGRGRGHMRRDVGFSNPIPASEIEIASAKTQTTGPTPSQKSVPQIFWCEICTVDCFTLETLEQHKNGKRHKKTVKKLEEMQAWRKLQLKNDERDTENDTSRQQPLNQAEQVTDGEKMIPANEEKDNVHGGQGNLQDILVAPVEEKNNVQDGHEKWENATAQAVEEKKNAQDGHQKVQEPKAVNENDLKRLEQNGSTDLQCGELEEKLTSEQPTNALSLSSRGGHAGRNTSKRKMTEFGGGDKRRRHLEPPVVCMICRIKCDTQAVFETHLVGRKHISRVKNFQRQQPTAGPLGYFHENPVYEHTSEGPPPIFYGSQPSEVSLQCADMQDAPVEFQTGEVQSEQVMEAVTKVGESVVSEGLNVVADCDAEKVKSDEGKTSVVSEGDDSKPDSAVSDEGKISVSE